MGSLVVALWITVLSIVDCFYHTEMHGDRTPVNRALVKATLLFSGLCALVLWPFFTWPLVLTSGALAVVQYLCLRWCTGGSIGWVTTGYILRIGAAILAYPCISAVALTPAGRMLAENLWHWYPAVAGISSADLALILLIASGYVFSVKGGTALVRSILGAFVKIKGRAGEISLQRYTMGELIGILERLIVLTLVLRRDYASIALVLAGKSLARFRELENQEFADYYLIGTLASLMVAMATGLALNLAIYCAHVGTIFKNL